MEFEVRSLSLYLYPSLCYLYVSFCVSVVYMYTVCLALFSVVHAMHCRFLSLSLSLSLTHLTHTDSLTLTYGLLNHPVTHSLIRTVTRSLTDPSHQYSDRFLVCTVYRTVSPALTHSSTIRDTVSLLMCT